MMAKTTQCLGSIRFLIFSNYWRCYPWENTVYKNRSMGFVGNFHKNVSISKTYFRLYAEYNTKLVLISIYKY